MSTNRDDDRDETFDDDSLQRADAYDDSHELPLPLPPLLGLDGQPVEITDEKLHELIDAMNNAGPIVSNSDPREDESTAEYTIANQILASAGQILFINQQTGEQTKEVCIILHASYTCSGCDETYGTDIALNITDKLPGFFRETAELADKLIEHNPFSE